MIASFKVDPTMRPVVTICPECLVEVKRYRDLQY